MDSFESVAAAILQRQGYWTQASVNVELTKQEKRANRAALVAAMGTQFLSRINGSNTVSGEID